MRFSQLAQMTGGRLVNIECGEHSFVGVSTDSRAIEPRQLFIALKGERVDGHRFIDQAVARGAAGVVSETDFADGLTLPANVALVAVRNTHEAMLTMAQRYLDSVPARRIGISGSNGKTTTKEYTFHMLSAVASDVYRSPGNYNNLYGIPMALFAMPQKTKLAVLEMGISVPGEMARLAAVVRPQVVAITNVSPTHLEFLGSVEAVAREKLSLIAKAGADVPLIINADDDLLVRETKKIRPAYVSFGIERDATFRPDAITRGEDGTINVTIENNRFCLPLFGQYQVYNLLAAYAVTRTLGYDFDDIDTTGIEFSTAPWRGETIVSGGVTFIADCYNANPDSVMAGLKSFAARSGRGRRIVVLGDMLELGERQDEYHRQAGRNLAAYPFDLVVLVGPLARYIADGAREAGVAPGRIRRYDDARTCADDMIAYLHEDDLVYLKGSRRIGLETIVTTWQNKQGDA